MNTRKAGVMRSRPNVRPLTARQRQTLLFVRDFIGAHGLSPTVREIGAHLGGVTTNAVVGHLDALISRGLIEVLSRSGRGVRLKGARWELAIDDSEAGRRLAVALRGSDGEGREAG